MGNIMGARFTALSMSSLSSIVSIYSVCELSNLSNTELILGIRVFCSYRI